MTPQARSQRQRSPSSSSSSDSGASPPPPETQSTASSDPLSRTTASERPGLSAPRCSEFQNSASACRSGRSGTRTAEVPRFRRPSRTSARHSSASVRGLAASVAVHTSMYMRARAHGGPGSGSVVWVSARESVSSIAHATSMSWSSASRSARPRSSMRERRRRSRVVDTARLVRSRAEDAAGGGATIEIGNLGLSPSPPTGPSCVTKLMIST